MDEMRRLKGTESWCFPLYSLSISRHRGKNTGISVAADKSPSDRQQFYEAVEEDEWRRRSGGLGKAGVGAAGVAAPLLATLHYGGNLQTRLNREAPVPHLHTQTQSMSVMNLHHIQ